MFIDDTRENAQESTTRKGDHFMSIEAFSYVRLRKILRLERKTSLVKKIAGPKNCSRFSTY